MDTFEAERRPVAEHNVRRSADPNGSFRSVEQEIDIDLGGRLAHSWIADVSTLDLLGDGWTILCGPQGSSWRAAASAAPVLVTVHTLDGAAGQALRVPTCGALLLRPDGKLVRAWDDANGIQECLAFISGKPVGI